MTTIKAPDIEQRQPACYLNYDRDVTVAIAAMIADGDAAFGPSATGEALWPVEAIYDEDTGRTHVGLSYIAPVVTL